jgi:hypothetical protein
MLKQLLDEMLLADCGLLFVEHGNHPSYVTPDGANSTRVLYRTEAIGKAHHIQNMPLFGDQSLQFAGAVVAQVISLHSRVE